MRLALVHARHVAVEAGAPAVADPGPGERIERTDGLLALAGVEPEDPVSPRGAAAIRETATELRCESVVLAFCPALVDAAAERERAGAVLASIEGELADVETVRAPADYHLAFDVETAGHPSAVRVVRPGADRDASAGFDAAPLADAGLAGRTDAGLVWTPAGTVARRALLAGVAERFARAGAEPLDPPLLPEREGVSEPAPDALRLADPPVLLRPRATFGAVSDSGAVYATGPSVHGSEGAGVHRPELMDSDSDSLSRWLALADEVLRALGFDPDVRARVASSEDAAAVRDALGDIAVETGAERTRVAFGTAGPTGIVERHERGVRCVPIGSARCALAALAPDLPPALAPTQLRLVPIDGAATRCRSLAEAFAARADVDDRQLPTGERLADAEDVPFLAVVGPDDDALPVSGPEGGETRLSPEDVDARIREAAGTWDWPPVPARRPVALSARRR